ncbi:MAG: acetyl-CoA carboxylase biotin carboxyl carrier protein subunit [Bacteroidia bacterium]|nr:acetyl-CoA carboxylase biotin carboxyl carrier protein subunit [Bacteroidia bacterium]NNJ56421.1 acetyl-CoA carboxylase biotin carboxyl carrier protein subunit [Bacteroidia bacterium]
MAKIEVNNKSYSITKKEDQLLFENESINYDIIKLPDGSFNLIVDNISYSIEVLKKETATGKLSLLINGRKVESTLHNKLAVLLKSMGMEGGKKKLKELKAPMPGLVLATNVKEGDEVEEGQDLLVLEAMKMENAIKSPQAGIIDKVFVTVNEKVDKNHILISFI